MALGGGGKKTSLINGIEGIVAETSSLGGMVAGCRVTTTATLQPNQQDDPEDICWDDVEEQRYREWLKEEVQNRGDANDVEWDETEAEESYRAKLRQQAEARAADDDAQIQWDDETEKAFRRKYLEMRKSQQEEANWSEYAAEEEHRERIRRLQESKKNQKVVWDDAEERKCQQRYRNKKY